MATFTKPKADTKFVDPKTAHLREVTGHYGPWTSAEWNAAFGYIEPTKAPEPDPPADVVEAAEARDVAMAAFERADNEWRKAALVEVRAKDPGEVRVTRDGQYITDPDVPRKLRKARAKAAETREARDIAEDALKRANAKWQALHTAWRHQLLADEYDANKQK